MKRLFMSFSFRKLKYRSSVVRRYLATGNLPRIVCYPEYPGKNTLLYRICTREGILLTNTLVKNAELVFRWQDRTFKDSIDMLGQCYPDSRIINGQCMDISKDRVQAVFQEAFGYSLKVDPANHSGNCLEKNNINATRDCYVVSCPVSQTREGFVYQKLVDNTDEEGRFVDLRVPVIGQCIPLVYKHYRGEDKRFARGMVKWEWFETDAIFSDHEFRNIMSFCAEVGLDFGELDVLRDNGDGKIYVVDANDTPVGPAMRSMSRSERNLIMDRMGKAFVRELLA